MVEHLPSMPETLVYIPINNYHTPYTCAEQDTDVQYS